MTPREAFLAALYNGPILPSDAIVIFSGDGKVRLDAATGWLRQRTAHYAVVSGGVDSPPHSLSAADSARYLIECGLAPDRIICDPDSQNTREQAEWLAEACKRHEWNRVLLVVSAYHMPRAFLTVLRSLKDRGLDDEVVILPGPASHVGWWDKPAGLDVTRMDLLAEEFGKIEEYGAKGHVASYDEGLEYLRYWEAVDDAA